MTCNMLRCRRCRFVVLMESEVVDGHGHPFFSASISAGNSPCRSPATHSVWFVGQQAMPSWIQEIIEQAMWTKGKLICPKCKGRLGSFNYISSSKCQCRAYALPEVHILRDRVDHIQKNLHSTSHNISLNNNHIFCYGEEKKNCLSECAAAKSCSGHFDDRCHPQQWTSAARRVAGPSANRLDLTDCQNGSRQPDDQFVQVTTGPGQSSPSITLLTDYHDAVYVGPDIVEDFDKIPLQMEGEICPNGKHLQVFQNFPGSDSNSVTLTNDAAGRFQNSGERNPKVKLGNVEGKNDRTSSNHQKKTSVHTNSLKPTDNNSNFNEENNHDESLAGVWSQDEYQSTLGSEIDFGKTDSVAEATQDIPVKNYFCQADDRIWTCGNQFEALSSQILSAADDEQVKVQETKEKNLSAELSSVATEHLCPICLDVFFNPHICVPCNHIFCETCLRRLSGNVPFDTPCPMCRQIIFRCFPEHALMKVIKAFYPTVYRNRRQTERRLVSKRHPLPQKSGGVLQQFRHRLVAGDGDNEEHPPFHVMFLETVHRWSVALMALLVALAVAAVGLVIISFLMSSVCSLISYMWTFASVLEFTFDTKAGMSRQQTQKNADLANRAIMTSILLLLAFRMWRCFFRRQPLH